jgi:hypothetical protein
LFSRQGKVVLSSSDAILHQYLFEFFVLNKNSTCEMLIHAHVSSCSSTLMRFYINDANMHQTSAQIPFHWPQICSPSLPVTGVQHIGMIVAWIKNESA